MAPSRVRIPPSPLSAAPAVVLRPPAEGWQSGRMRRSRKPLSVVRRIEGSNPSPSASDACRLRGWRRERRPLVHVHRAYLPEAEPLVHLLPHRRRSEHADVEAELECACERLAADRRADPAAAGVRHGADEVEARHARREETPRRMPRGRRRLGRRSAAKARRHPRRCVHTSRVPMPPPEVPRRSRARAPARTRRVRCPSRHARSGRPSASRRPRAPGGPRPCRAPGRRRSRALRDGFRGRLDASTARRATSRTPLVRIRFCDSVIAASARSGSKSARTTQLW